MTRRFVFRSTLRTNAATVWDHARTMRGVNAELWPLCRMTVPLEFEGKALEDAPLGVCAFRSWILVFGFLPVDYDDLVLVRVSPGVGFREESTMLTQRSWIHERTIADDGDGCTISDDVAFEPRVTFLAPMFGVMFRLAFWNRHRRLRWMF